jgi:purine-binding chemotaxis protein CheW
MTVSALGTSLHQYATFSAAGHYFGVDVLDVQEVLRDQRLTRVPLAPAVVEGLINLRGQIVPALDLRRRLLLGPREDQSSPVSVVVRTEHGAVSLQVDEIDDVVELDPTLLQVPPRNVDAGVRTLLVGVYKLNGRLLQVLDTRRTVCLDAG